MSKLIELDKNRYENFVSKHELKSHFLQSYNWGIFSKDKKNFQPFYLGLVDNNNKVIAACLLLQKSLPLCFCYFYSPRGFVIDFTNSKLVKEMTIEITRFCKNKKAIFFKIDPDIIRCQYNYLGENIKTNYNADKIYNDLKKIGYKHLGFTKNFETNQPRYTFRINMKQDMDTIFDHFSKTTKQRINKANKLGVEVSIGNINDINTFYELMAITENRKDFISFSKDYYKKQYEIFSKDNMAVLFLGKVNTKKIVSNYKKELLEIDNQFKEFDNKNLSKSAKSKIDNLTIKKEKLIKEINKYEDAQKQYGNIITLNAHMIITYDNKAWVLYAGNHNILTESYANYATYFEHIKYCKEHGIEIYDQFGTIGDLSKNNPRLGLHEFKKKFGGDYIEFLGEFDYVLKPFMYFVFTKLVPFYRNIIKNKSKKELKNEIKRNK